MSKARERDLEEALVILTRKLSSLFAVRGVGGRVTHKDWACLAQMVNNGMRALAGRKRHPTSPVEPLSPDDLQYWLQRYKEGSLY